MKKQELEKINEWIVRHHEHHMGLPDEDGLQCPDGESYVDSFELIEFLKTLNDTAFLS